MESRYLLNSTESHGVDRHLLVDTGKQVRVENFSRQSQPLLSRVFSFIEAHYQHSISLREVALAVGHDPAYLTHLVRLQTGKTVLNWIIEFRMTEARRLLTETDQSVEQIAKTVGYTDIRNFNRQFRRFHEASPRAWRRKQQST